MATELIVRSGVFLCCRVDWIWSRSCEIIFEVRLSVQFCLGSSQGGGGSRSGCVVVSYISWDFLVSPTVDTSHGPVATLARAGLGTPTVACA